MMNYKIQPTGSWAPTPSVTDPTSISGYVHPTYEVVETGSRLVIRSGMRQDEAKAICRHLNFGGGFDGWTPEFFLQPLKINVEDA